MKKMKTIKHGKAAAAVLFVSIAITGTVFAGCGKSAETAVQTTAPAVSEPETGPSPAVSSGESIPGESTEAESTAVESESFDMASENIPAAASGTYDGIVVDAAMNSLVISTAKGELYAVSLPETKDVVETSDGILLGQAVTVTCEDGVASVIKDCEKEPAADREALAFAADILFACKYRDINTLSSLAGYPVYVKLGKEEQTIENGGDFLKIPVSQVLSDERVEAVLSANLFELKELDGGKYVMGAQEGSPNIIFARDEGRDSGFAVTGIN